MRIAIVNDVPLAVEALRRVVCSVPGYVVAWMAADGEEAVRLCAADVPDLVLMDLVMPRVDGVEATRRIMAATPCPILVVTATVGGHAGAVFAAMGHGALDAVDTPILGPSGALDGAAPLLAKIATIGRLANGRAARGPAVTSALRTAPVSDAVAGCPLLAIGASTGGPGALVRLLSDLPRDMGVAVAIVQHIDARFAPGLAQWLATQSGHEVRVAAAHDRPTAGVVVVASTGDHLVLTPHGYAYVADPLNHPYRPSVDVFLHSVLRTWRGPGVSILLSGMGADGANGLLACRRAGWHTIAQDEATSIVYGMPKAAAALDAAVEILPVEQIAAAVVRALRRLSTGHSYPRSFT